MIDRNEIMHLAPIILFAYNRPEHMRRTVEALLENELASESILYIYCDGPKTDASQDTLQAIQEVRNYAHSITGFKEVIVKEQKVNKGLDPSEIDAITEVINIHGTMISVEDDLITNRYFLRFMNEALFFYCNDKRVYAIGGYTDAISFPDNYPHNIFASYRAESCGWATWADRWNKVEWDESKYRIIQHPTRSQIKRFNKAGDDFYPMLLNKLYGKTDAWDIRWGHTIYLNEGIVVRPTRSLLYNIGFDGTGVHSGVVAQSQVLLRTAPLYESKDYDITLVEGIKVDKAVQKSLMDYFRIPITPWWIRAKRYIKHRIKTIITYIRCR